MIERTKARAEQVIKEVELLYEQADQGPPEVLSNLALVVHQHEQQLKQQQQKEQQQQQKQQHSQTQRQLTILDSFSRV
jgi:hypothetical protein